MGKNLFLQFDSRRSSIFYPKFLEQGRLYLNYQPLWTGIGIGAVQFYIFLIIPQNFLLYWLIFRESLYPNLNILNSYFYQFAILARGLFVVLMYFTAHTINAIYLTLTLPINLLDYLLSPDDYSLDFLDEQRYKGIEARDMDITVEQGLAYHYFREYADWPYWMKPLGMLLTSIPDLLLVIFGLLPASFGLLVLSPLWHISEILEQTVVVIR